MIKVAIIDDGVNPDSYNISNISLSVEVDDNLDIVNYTSIDSTESSHGSICAAIISKYSTHSLLQSIKVKDTSSFGYMKKLYQGLRYCMEIGTDLISLSIGSIRLQDSYHLKKIVDQLYTKGIIIVAASSNDNSLTYPASFDNVIGVKKLGSRENVLEFYDKPINGINVAAPGTHILRDNIGRIKVLPSSNSYAAPYVAAMVAEIKYTKHQLSLSAMLQELKVRPRLQ